MSKCKRYKPSKSFDDLYCEHIKDDIALMLRLILYAAVLKFCINWDVVSLLF